MALRDPENELLVSVSEAKGIFVEKRRKMIPDLVLFIIVDFSFGVPVEAISVVATISEPGLVDLNQRVAFFQTMVWGSVAGCLGVSLPLDNHNSISSTGTMVGRTPNYRLLFSTQTVFGRTQQIYVEISFLYLHMVLVDVPIMESIT